MKKPSLKCAIRHINAAKIELIIFFAVLFVDLLTKYLVSHFIELDSSVTLIDGFLSFYYTKNVAAAFSFDYFGLSDKLGVGGMRIFFIILMSVTIIIFTAVLIAGRKNHKLYRISFVMIIAGALGNLYDRIFHEAVRDFIRVEYFGKELFGSKYFAIFNIADSALVVGVGLFIVYFLFFFSKDEKRKDAEKNAKNCCGGENDSQIGAEKSDEGELNE